MINETHTPLPRRITVAIAAGESQPHSLESIVRLAAGYEAKVTGVFIEDVDMLRAARLPFARELCRATNVVRSADSTEIERALKKRAAQVRDLIARTAEQAGAKWSFEVIRQPKARAVLELAMQTDVTVFAAASAHHYHGRTVPDIAASSARHPMSGESIVILVDQCAASRRVLQVAHILAAKRHIPIHAVTIAATRDELDRLAEQLQTSADIAASHINGLCRPQFNDIVRAAGAARPAAVILPIDLVAGSSDYVHELEEALENPILIVK